MNYHTQNPWTRSPQLFVHLTVEEANQLEKALETIQDQFGSVMSDHMDPNQLDALKQLKRTLFDALSRPRPHGLLGVTP